MGVMPRGPAAVFSQESMGTGATMNEQEVVGKIKGQVQVLLTQVDQAGKRHRPLELWGNSRVVNDLKHLLFLLRVPQVARDALADGGREPRRPFEYPRGDCGGCSS